jgi:threonine aldolase
MRDFRSDNTQGCSAEVMEALGRANEGTATSYGGDEITARVRERCREIFECDLEIFPVITGTAGNALAIAAMTPPDGVVLCHEDAHIVRDELGAPEFFTGGARLLTLAGPAGKLWSAAAQPPLSCLSLTNATEAGTVYSPSELAALTSSVDAKVHLDGARFANAVVSLNCTPAEATWKSGVDILVFGGTKNGLINAELIVVFRRELAAEIAPRWHRSGHRPSKMRFLSAQFEAYLKDDLWLRNARHANAMAARLAAGLETIHPVQANVVFTRFAPEVAQALRGQGFDFFEWPIFWEDAYRLVTGFGTREEDVDALLSAIRQAAARDLPAPRSHSR